MRALVSGFSDAGFAAFDARIDDECRTGVIADCRNHGLDIGIDEIECALVRARSFIGAGCLVDAGILRLCRLHACNNCA